MVKRKHTLAKITRHIDSYGKKIVSHLTTSSELRNAEKRKATTQHLRNDLAKMQVSMKTLKEKLHSNSNHTKEEDEAIKSQMMRLADDMQALTKKLQSLSQETQKIAIQN